MEIVYTGNHRLRRIRILRISKIHKIHDFFPNFKMPTNFSNKIRSADIIALYEIFSASINKFSFKFFADIYYYLGL